MRPTNRHCIAAAILTLALTACGGGGGSAPPPPAPTVSLTATPASVVSGNSTNLVWSSTNATSCTASGSWTGGRPTGSSETSAVLTANATFTLTCTGDGGTGSATASVTVTNPVPTITLTATPATVVIGAGTTLNWTTTNANSCTASGGWTGTRGTAGPQTITPINVTTTFTLTCTNTAGGSATQSVTVTAVPNTPPTANAGTNRVVNQGALVTLIGSASSDSDGTISNYSWAQTAGPAVTLTPTGSDATFTAPTVTVATIFTFRLIVTDNVGAVSAPATVQVTVNPLTAGQAAISGRITFARIPVSTTGWIYAAAAQQPARGITVEIVNSASGAIVTTGQTDGDGFYSLVVAPNTNVFVRARAELVKANGAPTWRVEVRDVEAGNTQFTARSSDVNSGTGVTQNLAIQSGWDPTTRAANGPRDAAPFAVLDTMYRAIQKVTTLNATLALPALIVDWAPNNTGGETFFTVSTNNTNPKIVLAGQPDNDTDEYDQHVIAHEFGHYIEWAFGRSDSIGGQHSLADLLDPRVAWGEGFGYWFACFVMDDPLAVDTGGTQQAQAGSFNVETINVTGTRGWFREASVFALLWDLYDPANDDQAALGAAPMWAVLTNQIRSAESLVTIFTFASALRAANPSSAAAIDSVLASQSIVGSTIDEFGSTETNGAGNAAVLPVYKTINRGGQLVVTSLANFGSINKLGISQFLRLNIATVPTSIQITATGPTGRDPDVYVYRRGAEVGAGTTNSNESFTVPISQAGTYIIEVQDCDNVGADCTGATPNPANTNITVTVQ